MSMEIFFLQSLCWKEKAVSGHDPLIDIPVLTQLLCEAFNLVLEIWPDISGKIFPSALMPQLSESPNVPAGTQPSTLWPDWRPATQRHQPTKASLFIPSVVKPCSQWLGGKRWIFPKTSHWISGCCWEGWQHLPLFILGNPGFWMQTF